MNEFTPEGGTMPPVERVRQEVDRWLEAVRTTGERAMETLGLTGANRPMSPPADVIELPEEVIVQLDLPGVSANQVELTLVGNMLTVVASRERQPAAAESRFHLRERAIGRFQRSIPLPATVNEEAIKAETRDGLLTVTLKKLSPTPGRSIPVATGSSNPLE